MNNFLADLVLVSLFVSMEQDHSRFNARFGHIYRTLQAFHRRTGLFLQCPLSHEDTNLCIARW